MADDDKEDDDDRELTAADRRKLRRMMERDERVEWLYAQGRVWAGWIAAVSAGTYAVVQAARESGFLKKIGF